MVCFGLAIHENVIADVHCTQEFLQHLLSLALKNFSRGRQTKYECFVFFQPLMGGEGCAVVALRRQWELKIALTKVFQKWHGTGKVLYNLICSRSWVPFSFDSLVRKLYVNAASKLVRDSLV